MRSTRYQLGAEHAVGRRLLEVACGAAMGAEVLSAASAFYVATDVDMANVAVAAASMSTAGLSCSNAVVNDAAHLPYPNSSFDTVMMFEAIYYLESPGASR